MMTMRLSQEYQEKGQIFLFYRFFVFQQFHYLPIKDLSNLINVNKILFENCCKENIIKAQIFENFSYYYWH